LIRLYRWCHSHITDQWFTPARKNNTASRLSGEDITFFFDRLYKAVKRNLKTVQDWDCRSQKAWLKMGGNLTAELKGNELSMI
jgi:hypothetical protein